MVAKRPCVSEPLRKGSGSTRTRWDMVFRGRRAPGWKIRQKVEGTNVRGTSLDQVTVSEEVALTSDRFQPLKLTCAVLALACALFVELTVFPPKVHLALNESRGSYCSLYTEPLHCTIRASSLPFSLAPVCPSAVGRLSSHPQPSPLPTLCML